MKSYLIRFFSYVVLILILMSCSEIFREECRVTGNYKDYYCEDGFETIEDSMLRKESWINYDSCQFSVSRGCGFFLKDLESYYRIIDSSETNHYDSSDAFWDFKTRSIIGFSVLSDYGLTIYSSIFLCKNEQDQELLVRCQYEISDQCAGSEIMEWPMAYWISIPKFYDDYKLKISVENTNPIK